MPKTWARTAGHSWTIALKLLSLLLRHGPVTNSVSMKSSLEHCFSQIGRQKNQAKISHATRAGKHVQEARFEFKPRFLFPQIPPNPPKCESYTPNLWKPKPLEHNELAHESPWASEGTILKRSSHEWAIIHWIHPANMQTYAYIASYANAVSALLGIHDCPWWFHLITVQPFSLLFMHAQMITVLLGFIGKLRPFTFIFISIHIFHKVNIVQVAHPKSSSPLRCRTRRSSWEHWTMSPWPGPNASKNIQDIQTLSAEGQRQRLQMPLGSL